MAVFLYEGSLQLYSFSKEAAFQNIEYVNRIFKSEYGKLAEGHIVFAQDALGNQFSFVTRES